MSYETHNYFLFTPMLHEIATGSISRSGFFAWIFWRTVYLTKLIGFGNKVRVAVDWTLNFFYPRDTSEIE